MFRSFSWKKEKALASNPPSAFAKVINWGLKNFLDLGGENNSLPFYFLLRSFLLKICLVEK